MDFIVAPSALAFGCNVFLGSSIVWHGSPRRIAVAMYSRTCGRLSLP